MWWLQSFQLTVCCWFPVRDPDGSPARPSPILLGHTQLTFLVIFFALCWFILHWFEWVLVVQYENVINDLC